ncbi:hypothetical protein FRAHR75_180023 [Frankia sp. Hr75.2]|nr:hypothetical protein FRAHR75_180023 [Frankia sp. Hr75.2]
MTEAGGEPAAVAPDAGSSDLSRLSAQEKRALLAELLARKAGGPPPTGALAPIGRLPRGGDLPMSFAQERLWFLHQMAPTSPLYNISMALRLTSPLEPELLARAVRAVVERHETLRVRFASVDGVPRQVPGPAPDVPVAFVDLAALSGPEQQEQLDACLAAAATEPFDLTTGPLLRLVAVRLSPSEQVVHLTMHHIISDAWSIALFARETMIFYQAMSYQAVSAEPRTSPAPEPSALPVHPRLPRLPVQYADYAHWQRSILTADVEAAELAFWRERLAGARPLDLPTDRPRPALPSMAGERVRLVLPAERADRLRAFCREAGTTLFTALLAAFDVVLGRYSGQDDFVVGTPVSSRSRAEVEGLIGVFVNTLVIRTRLTGDPGYRELVSRVHAEVLAATAHQTLPFERLITELALDRRLDTTPLFNVLFVAPQGPVGTVDVDGRTATMLDVHSGTAKFDLSLAVVTRDDQIALYLDYRSAVFDRVTAEGMLRHLDAALAVMLADPRLPLSRVSLLEPAERRRALLDWNASGAGERPVEGMIPEAFADQVARCPDATAATCGEEQVTYRELDRRVGLLAARLRAAGIGVGDVVAVGLPRCVDLLVATLAGWRVGAVYLPVEPGHPPGRIGFMLADAGAQIVATDGAGAVTFEGCGVPLLRIDSAADVEISGGADADASTGTGTGTPDDPTPPDRDAYIIYTSGSTGRPKGVVIGHGNLARYLRWVNDTLLADRVDVLPAVSEPSFDGSFKQLFAPLVRGGEVWLIPAEVVRDPRVLLEQLSAWTTRHGPDRRLGFTSVPSLWNAVLDALDCGAPVPRLSSLILGGDHFPPRLPERTWTHCPGLEIWNLYGPTETTATAAAGRVVPGEPVTIGRPVDGIELYLLDGRLEPVPVGLPGRLYIGGPNVARGYLNRDQETAARFVAHPFRVGARAYDSGDVGRYLPDGRIRLLQRQDGQVKLRGRRLELGEVQAVIGEHPAVREALVRVAGEGEDRRLIAYVQPAAGATDVAEQVRAFLLDRLPRWMVPTVIVELAAFPRLPSGKTDVSALPVPAPGRPAGLASVAPRTDLERRIAAVWREVLGVPDVGVHDNLFDLGGHSLLLLQIQARLSAQLGRDIPVVELFRHPDVASLAEHLARQAPGGDAGGPGPAADDTRLERMAQARHRLARVREKGQPR